MPDRTDLLTRPGATGSVRLGCVLVAFVLLVAAPAAATAGTAQSTDSTTLQPAEPAFVVDLDADGSARVTLVTTFDLTTDSEREAFGALRANETAQERRADQFADRVRAIVTRAEDGTERDMAVHSPNITYTTTDDSGIVSLSVTWDGLVVQEGDRLVLREPFASGFDIDRPFRVVAPDGYEVGTATPTPTTQQGNSAMWNANTQFEGFETGFVPTGNKTVADAPNGTSGAGTPGFGVITTAVAAMVATALLVRQGRNAR